MLVGLQPRDELLLASEVRVLSPLAGRLVQAAQAAGNVCLNLTLRSAGEGLGYAPRWLPVTHLSSPFCSREAGVCEPSGHFPRGERLGLFPRKGCAATLQPTDVRISASPSLGLEMLQPQPLLPC